MYLGKKNHLQTMSGLTATAGGFFLAGQSSADHGGRAAHAAFDRDGICRAVLLACAAFHAGFRARQHGQAAVHHEHSMRTDDRTHFAAGAGGRVILEGGGLIGVEHGWPPLTGQTRGKH